MRATAAIGDPVRTSEAPAEFDYIVVGAGTAGSVLAGRLCEGGRASVLVLEAGPDSGGVLARIPAMSARFIGSQRRDWAYRAEPDPSRGQQQDAWPAGKMVGGTAALNGMLFVRGSAADYDAWADAGNPGWSHAELLPHFKALEATTLGDAASRGTAGPLTVSTTRTVHPLCEALASAMTARGIPPTSDYNGANFEGSGLAQVTQANGLRMTTAGAFLLPRVRSGRVKLWRGSRVLRLTFEQDRCTGAELLRSGKRQRVTARREVIVCAGAIGSPTLLLRSGIGPADELQQVGVLPLTNLPGVGRSLMDHPVAMLTVGVNCSTYNLDTRGIGGLRHALDFALHRRGALASPHAHLLAHLRSHPGVPRPDTQLALYPMSFERTEDGVRRGTEQSILLTITTCHPQGRGRVTLRSDDPLAAPRIEHALLGHPADVANLVAGCRLAQSLLQTPPMAQYMRQSIEPGPDVQTDAQWEAYLRGGGAAPGYHGAGTCRMGPKADETAVVDAALCVRGVRGLRVADTSIMPSMVSGNTQAAAAVIGAKAAQLILG